MRKFVIFLLTIAISSTVALAQNDEAGLANAQSLLEAGKWDKANESFTSLINASKDKPFKSKAHFGRGIARRNLADYNGSEVDFNKVLEYDPARTEAYVERGKTRVLKKDVMGANADFDLAMNKDATGPAGKAALYESGMLNMAQGKHQRAIDLFTKYLNLDPNNALVYFQRAEGYMTLRKFDEAIADYSKVTSIDANYKEAYTGRAKANIGKLQNQGVKSPNAEQSAPICADLNKAKALGDKSTKDLLFSYCK
jgi:tetratricopeptide (TPR) repeat protein